MHWRSTYCVTSSVLQLPDFERQCRVPSWLRVVNIVSPVLANTSHSAASIHINWHLDCVHACAYRPCMHAHVLDWHTPVVDSPNACTASKLQYPQDVHAMDPITVAMQTQSSMRVMILGGCLHMTTLTHNQSSLQVPTACM